MEWRNRKSGRVPGVYALCCEASGGAYIGSAVSLYSRLHSHASLLRAGRHPNRRLQDDYTSLGANGVSFVVLDVTRSPADLPEMETKAMVAARDAGWKLYNATGRTKRKPWNAYQKRLTEK